MLIERQHSITANLVAFCRHLRQEGFVIGPAEEQLALSALHLVEAVDSAATFQLALQTSLCKNVAQQHAFSDLYNNYWRELDKAVDSKQKDVEEEIKQQKQSGTAPGIEALKSWLYGNKSEEEKEVASYSAAMAIGGQQALAFDEKELKRVFVLVKKLVNKLANRRSRRYTSSHLPANLDLYRTMRKNIGRHEELIELAYRQKKVNQLRLVLFCDLSKSMELYSRFLLQFMYAFQQSFPLVSAYGFSTRLHPISVALSEREADKALQKVLNAIPDWGSGTRIGESLKTFNETDAHRQLNNRTIVIILSDGWDTGEPEVIAQQMRYIHRRALQVLWLNPLAGNPTWQPEVQGMLAALPYIDQLLPFHDLLSLEKLVKEIKV